MHELICEHCKELVSGTTDTCFTCGQPVGAPNVRSANKAEEKRALESRYNKVLNDAAANGTRDRLKDFSRKMDLTCAVFNVDISFLHTFITNEKTLYTSYRLGVKGQLRKPAEVESDRHRLAVEGMLFGSYGENIRYAALSLDGVGVRSYGDYSLRFRDVAINMRSTLLEDNSYVFVEKHGMVAGQEIPIGYRCTWEEREKLALAKLAQRISSASSEQDYPGILLFSDGDYRTDDFIEIHIYGPFDAHAIESVMGSSNRGNNVEIAMVEAVKEHLENAGKRWIEA